MILNFKVDILDISRKIYLEKKKRKKQYRTLKFEDQNLNRTFTSKLLFFRYRKMVILFKRLIMMVGLLDIPLVNTTNGTLRLLKWHLAFFHFTYI